MPLNIQEHSHGSRSHAWGSVENIRPVMKWDLSKQVLMDLRAPVLQCRWSRIDTQCRYSGRFSQKCSLSSDNRIRQNGSRWSVQPRTTSLWFILNLNLYHSAATEAHQQNESRARLSSFSLDYRQSWDDTWGRRERKESMWGGERRNKWRRKRGPQVIRLSEKTCSAEYISRRNAARQIAIG